jgi:hypothetical protein
MARDSGSQAESRSSFRKKATAVPALDFWRQINVLQGTVHTECGAGRRCV